MKKALITGVLGQDGSYLAQHALNNGFEVIGGARGELTDDRLWRLRHLGIADQVQFTPFDLGDSALIEQQIKLHKPDLIFNMAAQSSVGDSFSTPLATAEVGGMGALRIFEVARWADWAPRVFQASSSEIFGCIADAQHSENTGFNPKTPYGATKLFAHIMAEAYRASYGTFVSTGILFNHESPLRGENFVTRKITKSLAQIRAGRLDTLYLGNLDACRDWSHARDFVDAMWRIVQLPKPDNFVIASGRLISVREFTTMAAARAGFDLTWTGQGVNEKGFDRQTGQLIVAVDPAFYRPYDPTQPKVNTSKATSMLGWTPQTSLEDLVKEMVDFEILQIALSIKTSAISSKSAPHHPAPSDLPSKIIKV
jgi:GDPmannose 4,6-dehydratase